MVFFAYNNKYWRYRHADMLAWEQGGRSPPQPQIASPQCSPKGWQQWGGSSPPPMGEAKGRFGGSGLVLLPQKRSLTSQ